MIDLDAYCSRIGYRGPRAATLDTLAAVHRLHPQAIPFENLAPFLGEDVRLDLPALQGKLVQRGRGGYCFEHNLLLGAVLEQLGFDVRRLAARVRWNYPAHAVTARSHMLLLVTVEGRRFIADVGFGGLTLTAPLQLDETAAQSTPHEPWRLRPLGAGFLLETSLGGEWRPVYAFDLQPQELIDYEAMSWYFSKHPRSPFVTGLMLARPEEGRRHALRDAEYSLHLTSGGTQRRTLTQVAELRELLAEAFRLELPAVRSIDDALARLLRSCNERHGLTAPAAMP